MVKLLTQEVSMAAGSASIDAVLADAVAKLDGLQKRMDALETKPGSNNPIKGDDDDDDKRDDAKSRGDDDDDKRDDDDDDDKKDDSSAGTAPKTKILDDAKGASKADAAKSKAPMKDDAKKSDDGELEIKHGKEKDDSAKSDDDDDDKKDDSKKADAKKADAGIEEKKDDSARADEIGIIRKEMAATQATIARLEALMKPRSDDEHAAFADAQARADGVFAGFGLRAPRPLDGEQLIDYRKRLAKKMKGYSTVWKDSKFARMDDNTFAIAENQIYADATAAAANPMDLEAGELRMVAKIDPQTGVRSNVFYGKESFVKAMGRPGRRVTGFRTMPSN